MSHPYYPEDLTGSAPTHLVTNEVHQVNSAHIQDHHFIIPIYAPFYVDDFIATLQVPPNPPVTLVEDVDYSFAIPYVTGTRVTGKAMYAAIILHNINQQQHQHGIVTLQYRTLGGDHVIDRNYVIQWLADRAYNPRIIIWDVITNSPAAFPPRPHYNDYDDFYGQEEVVTKLEEIRQAILGLPGNIQVFIDQLLQQLGIHPNINPNDPFVRRTGDVMSGYLSLHSDPIQPMHASTKQYVDYNNAIQDSELKEYLLFLMNRMP